MDDRTKDLLDRAEGKPAPEHPASADHTPQPYSPHNTPSNPETNPTPTPNPNTNPTPQPTSSFVRPLLAATNIHKPYRLGKVDVPDLRGAPLHTHNAEFLAIRGASGPGNSTLRPTL